MVQRNRIRTKRDKRMFQDKGTAAAAAAAAEE
jgi:hypothetical protein